MSAHHTVPEGPEADTGIIRAVPLRHPWRWVAVAVLGVLTAMFVHSLVVNPRWQWDFVRGYLTYHAILKGVVVTVELTALAMAIGIVLGILLAVMRMSGNYVLSTVAWLYTWFFRGTPVLVQLLFWYAFSLLFHDLSIGIPFGPKFHTWDTNTLITPFIAGVLGLGLNEAAYMAEIARAGLLSVDPGQQEAATALGMSLGKSMRRIVLPQAMRVIIPPTGNETISMLKTTSLVATISVLDLTGTAELIYGSNSLQIPLLVVISIWYLAMTSVLSFGQYFVERRFSRGTRALSQRPARRMLSRMTATRRAEDSPSVGGL